MSGEHSNGEVSVYWDKAKCIHAAECVKGLPKVFRPNEKPWIHANEASSDELIAQVNKCPSGALTYRKEGEKMEDQNRNTGNTKVDVMPNGPVLVHGDITVKNSDGTEETKSKVTAFCRCGASANKPYCDGEHGKIGFEG